jgi:5-hydroxyisourate hydrolase
MSPITSHVLDTALGVPARNLAVRIDRLDPGGSWTTLGEAFTDDDGRISDFPGTAELRDGTYRVTFDTGAYFEAAKRPVFFPLVNVVFRVAGAQGHYHIPLLLSPFGYSTYRGS